MKAVLTLPAEPQWPTIELQLFADDQDRQEPASPRRRQQARQRGEVFQSRELSSAGLLLVALALLRAGGPMAVRALAALFEGAYGQWLQVDWSEGELWLWGAAAVKTWLLGTGPLMLGLVVAGIAFGLAQVGFLWTLEPLAPKLTRIDPMAGMKRMFSRRSLFELFKAVLRLLIVGSVAYAGARRAIDRILLAAGGDLGAQIGLVGREALAVLWQGAAALLALAVLDALFQRYEHERRLRMSRQEVKQEMKETEGDPQLRSRVRARQRELSRNRLVQEVARADVVVTNPTRVAVALVYDPATMAAPVVVAKGRDHMARQIKATAQQHGVLWVQEPFLARRLYKDVAIGDAVPEALYGAVAEVIAFVWRLKGRSRGYPKEVL